MYDSNLKDTSIYNSMEDSIRFQITEEVLAAMAKYIDEIGDLKEKVAH